jgi:hypothetical protein
MGKNFRDATEALFSKLGAEDLAKEMGCSLGAIKQARMNPDSASHRPPPAEWEKAAKALAERQATFFSKLAKSL